MTIVTVSVRPTHRYFMNKSKSDIIYQIGCITGKSFNTIDYANMMLLTKSQLASKAMDALRSLPPEPTKQDRLLRLAKEYRDTMDREVMTSWAKDVVAAIMEGER